MSISPPSHGRRSQRLTRRTTKARSKPRASPRSAKRERSGRHVGKLSPDQRKAHGAAINALKDKVAQALAAQRSVLKNAALEAQLKRETVDVTLPVRLAGIETGRIHPISQVMDEIVAIFADMGFSVAEGPDIETDDYNFTKLTSRPATPRATCTIRSFSPPTRMASASSCARTRARSGCHDARAEAAHPHICPWPHLSARRRPDAYADVPSGRRAGDRRSRDARQPEVGFGGILQGVFECCMWACGSRPSYFPFTSPSLEVDIQCRRSRGVIRFGEGDDWLEILGCGMVHPNVLSNCGIDPQADQGFAWGMETLDSVAMLKYGLPDLRDFFDADLRWINHHGFKPLDIPTLAGGLSG